MVSASSGDIPLAYTTFGPTLSGCQNCFDFTLVFEESFLSIALSAFILLIAPLRLFVLFDKQKILDAQQLQFVKLITIIALGALRLALIIIYALEPSQRTETTLPAAILSFVSIIPIAWLSFWEHARQPRPSSALSIYFAASVLFDIARVRSVWLANSLAVSLCFSMAFGFELVAMILEGREKGRWVHTTQEKTESPETTAGIYSRGSFWWINRLIYSGRKKVLAVTDLWSIGEEMTSSILKQKLMAKWDNSLPGKWRLIKALACAFHWDLLLPVIPRICLLGFTICQPILMSRFLGFLQSPEESDNIGYGLIGAYGIVYLGIGISNGIYSYYVYRSVTKVRGALVSVIYDKTMDISITAVENAEAVTLMSSDVARITSAMDSLHEIWANLIEVGLITWLLALRLGVACVVPIAVSIISAVLTIYISKAAGKKQVKWMEHVSRRVALTAETLSSMRGIKMLGLTDVMKHYLARLRREELAAGNSFRLVIVWTAVLAFCPQLLAPVITFGVALGVGNNLISISSAFASLSLIILATSPLSQLFQHAPALFGAVGCCGRIQAYLESQSRDDRRSISESEASSLVAQEQVDKQNTLVSTRSDNQRCENAIEIRAGKFGWTSDKPGILSDINITVPKGALVMLVGPVASGKTTFLKAILGEVPFSQGSVQLLGLSRGIAFCDQTPWIQNGTIRDNIVGYSLFNQEWYSQVVHAVALTEDFAALPKQDSTLVGSKGITLSGGQKQRVALARAVYAKSDIRIFDDVFSGLDLQTQQIIFQRLFGLQGLLRSSEQTNLIATHSVHLLSMADKVIVLGSDGKIAEQGPLEELDNSINYISKLNDPESKDEQEVEETLKHQEFRTEAEKEADDRAEEIARRDGDFSVYAYYFRSVGWSAAAFFLVTEIGFGFLSAFPSAWLEFWTNAIAEGHDDSGYYLGMYTMLQVLALIMLCLSCWHTLNTMIRLSGTHFHEVLLNVVMNAPMSFHSKTDVGITTNRFSQDLQLIDWDLALALLNVCATVFIVLTQAALIATSSGYVALTFPFIALVYYLIQKYYLKTSRQLRFMDIEAKSPLYTQFLESLSGLATIRAFGWQNESKERNQDLLNISQRPFYLMFMIQQWLEVVLALVITGLALVMVGLAVGLRHTVSPGFVGVALLNLVSLATSLRGLISGWTQAETSIGAVARIRALEKDVSSEHLDIEQADLPPSWPFRGEIRFEDLSATYDSSGENNGIDHISFEIQAGQKIGICGRSGSGKSTLVSTLFRLIDTRSGKIEVDGIRLDTIPRTRLRSSLIALPQEPLLLAGASIRFNADPFEEFDDEKISGALQKVGLLSVFDGGRDLGVELKANDLSHGQRQLFCLARAILRPGRIVVLDEATSNVDKTTDNLMQRIIREEFAGRTIIAIAHRLETIADFDTVIVMDEGRIIEAGNPQQLLNSHNSRFKELYQTWGKHANDGMQ